MNRRDFCLNSLKTVVKIAQNEQERIVSLSFPPIQCEFEAHYKFMHCLTTVQCMYKNIDTHSFKVLRIRV